MLPAKILARIQECQTGVIHSSGERSGFIGGDLEAESRRQQQKWAQLSTRTTWCVHFLLNEGIFPHFQIRMKLSGGPSPDDEPPLPPCHALAGRGGGGGREDAVGFRQRLPQPPNTGFFRVSQQPPSLFPNMARPECVKRQLTSAELPVSLLLDIKSWQIK